MFDYLTKRITDALTSPTVLVSPDTVDTSDPAGVAHVRASSKLRFTFSEKAVGAGDTSKYRFTVGATPYTNLFTSIAGLIPDTDAATPDGLLASQYLTTGVKETWEATFGNLTALDGSTLTFDPTLLLDGSANAFALDAANTSPLQFLVDAGAGADLSVSAEAILTDSPGTANQRILTLATGSSGVDVPFALESTRELSVKIVTEFPGTVPPSATLSRPGSSNVALVFDGLEATVLTATELNVYGEYHLHIDAYVNGAGTTLPAADYYFAVVNAADYSASATPDALEGWGYFPREEGLPTACPESGSFTPWTGAGSGTPTAGGGNPLSISTIRSYARTYSAMFKNSSGAGDPWNASAYVEAAISASGTPGTNTNYFDADNSSNKLGLTGAGIRFRNGPYICECALLTVISGGQKYVGIRVFNADPNVRAYKLSSVAVNWDSASTLKVLKVQKTGTTYTVSVDGGAAVITIDEKVLPRAHYEDINAAEVAFGVLENVGQTVTAVFEFLRYAFYDAANAIGAGAPANALSVGFPNIYRDATDQAVPVFRSTNITVNGSPNTEPAYTSDTPTLTIGATVTKTAAGVLAAKAIPVKVRFCIADFNDLGAAGDRSVSGFTDPSTFPAYGAATIAPIAAGVSTRAASVVAGASATATPTAFSWTVTVDRTRSRRRLFILVYADAPLLSAPKLIAAKSAADYFDRTLSAGIRTDPRGAIRQFLPDFFVRDNDTDDGSSLAGGSLSPDIGMAIFMGDAAHTLPNPQGTGESHYPKGFAQGQPVPYDYKPSGYIEIDSTNPDPTKKIKLTDSGWSDDGTTPQCYYNRMWVRLSNRGIVPGPANVQLFFLGSALRAAFDPSAARTNAYEKIYAKVPISPADYVQTKFQHYDPATGNLDSTLVEAVPALSGVSDPATTKNFVIAEFVWHVGATEVPASTADSHGCRATCINLVGAASGIDTAPNIVVTDSIWAANMGTNNISVRNSNIVQGQPPGASDPPYTTKALIKDDSPVTYKKLPNDFKPTFSRRHARWGIGVNAKKFTEGAVVLRVAAVIAERAKPRDMEELEPGAKGIKSGFRFFQLKGGSVGYLEGIEPILERPRERQVTPFVNVFFQPKPGAKPGRYEITVFQTAEGKEVGGYRTVVSIPKEGEIRFVGDERTKILYDLARDPDALKAIPYEKRSPFTGIGLAMQERMRLSPAIAVQFYRGKLVNEIANMPKGYKPPQTPEVIPLFEGGHMGAVIGRIADRKGAGVSGLLVMAADVKTGVELGHADTDENGRYLIHVRAEGKQIPLKALGRDIVISILKPGIKKPLFSVKQTIDDYCLAPKEVILGAPAPKPLKKPAVKAKAKKTTKKKTAVKAKAKAKSGANRKLAAKPKDKAKRATKKKPVKKAEVARKKNGAKTKKVKKGK